MYNQSSHKSALNVILEINAFYRTRAYVIFSHNVHRPTVRGLS